MKLNNRNSTSMKGSFANIFISPLTRKKDREIGNKLRPVATNPNTPSPDTTPPKTEPPLPEKDNVPPEDSLLYPSGNMDISQEINEDYDLVMEDSSSDATKKNHRTPAKNVNREWNACIDEDVMMNDLQTPAKYVNQEWNANINDDMENPATFSPLQPRTKKIRSQKSTTKVRTILRSVRKSISKKIASIGRHTNGQQTNQELVRPVDLFRSQQDDSQGCARCRNGRENGRKRPHETREEKIDSAIRTVMDLVGPEGRVCSKLNGLAMFIFDMNDNQQRPADQANNTECNAPIKLVLSKPKRIQRRNQKPYYNQTTVHIVKLPICKNENSQKNVRTVQRYARQVIQILNVMSKREEVVQKAIMQAVVRTLGGTARWSEQTWLTVEDALTLRESGSCGGVISTNQIVKLLNDIGKLLEIKHFCPTQLKKKIREEHAKRLLKVDFCTVDVEGKQVVMYWIKNQPLLIESLIRSSHLDGTYEVSQDFSNFNNEEILLRGVDKGFEDISDMIRFVNRSSGNSGLFSIPICTVEDAAENYENLKKTCFSKVRSSIFNRAYAREFHILTVNGNVKANDGSARDDDKESQAILVGFKSETNNPSFSPKNLKVTASVNMERVITLRSEDALKCFRQSSTFAKCDDRVEPSIVLLQGDQPDIHIEIILVKYPGDLSDEDDNLIVCGSKSADTYIGCKLISNDNIIYSFEFDYPSILASGNNLTQVFSAHCRSLRLMNCDDGKMNASTHGLRTCTSKYSCPSCIRPTSSLELEEWLLNMDAFNPDDVVHALSLSFCLSGKHKDSKCIRFRFTCQSDVAIKQKHLQPRFEVQHGAICLDTKEKMDNFSSRSIGMIGKGCDVLDSIDINKNELEGILIQDSIELNLQLKMVHVPVTEDKWMFIGCEVSTSMNRTVCCLKFSSPIEYVVPGRICFGTRCNQALSLSVDINKMPVAVIGLRSCKSRIWHHREAFEKDVKVITNCLSNEFLSTIMDDTKLHLIKSYPKREGDLSIERSYERARLELGGDHKESTYALKDSAAEKRAVNAGYSVLQKPLRYEDPNLFIPDGLHLFEGMAKHTNTLCAEKLKIIDSSTSENNAGWNLKQKCELSLRESEAERKSLTANPEYKKAKQKFGGLTKKRTALSNKVSEEKKKDKTDQDTVYILEKELEISNLETEMFDGCLRQGLGNWNRQIRGHNEFEKEIKTKLAAIAKSKKGESDEALGESQFIFMQAIRCQVGHFSKQHGATTLTGNRSLSCFERREPISETTAKSWSEDEAKNKKVRETVEDYWEEAAATLHELGLLMKSQEKLDGERLKKLDTLLVAFILNWIKYSNEVKSNPIYWKCHNMFCGLHRFAHLSGMIGRVSAEGFENKHVFMRRLKELMRPISNTRVRVNTISQRQQISVLHPGVVKRQHFIQGKTKRRVRIRAKKAAKNYREGEDTEKRVFIDEHDDDTPDGFIATENDGLLPNSFSDMYNYLVRDMAPSTFYEPFETNDSLGSKLKGDAKYL